MCKINNEAVLVAVENEETVTAVFPNNKKVHKTDIDIFLTDEAAVREVAESYAKKNGVKINGHGEIGTIVLRHKNFTKSKVETGKKAKIAMLATSDEYVTLGFLEGISADSSLPRSSSKTRHFQVSAAEKNSLPTEAPLQCWKFSGTQNGFAIVVAFFFSGSKKKEIVQVSDIKNSTVAKKQIVLNGIKYTIKKDGKGNKTLVNKDFLLPKRSE